MKFNINFKSAKIWIIIGIVIILVLTGAYMSIDNLQNETITLKMYHPNNDATGTIAKDYVIYKNVYNKDKNKELVKAMNLELGLGINKLVINENKAVVDISKESSQKKFDNGSAGGTMAVESLINTIFANTEATVIKVTVDGKEKVEGSHFSFAQDFTK